MVNSGLSPSICASCGNSPLSLPERGCPPLQAGMLGADRGQAGSQRGQLIGAGDGRQQRQKRDSN